MQTAPRWVIHTSVTQGGITAVTVSLVAVCSVIQYISIQYNNLQLTRELSTLEPCESVFCENRGVCQPNTDTSFRGYHCDCTRDYAGSNTLVYKHALSIWIVLKSPRFIIFLIEILSYLVCISKSEPKVKLGKKWLK